MDKIYRLRSVANERLSKRGHVFSRYKREFHRVDGILVRVLYNNCNRCGAWVRITDYPKYLKGFPNKELLGPAFNYNCKNGEVPVEKAEFSTVFAGDFKERYGKVLENKRKKALRKFQI